MKGLMSLNPRACEFLVRPMKNEVKLNSRRKALRDISNNGGSPISSLSCTRICVCVTASECVLFETLTFGDASFCLVAKKLWGQRTFFREGKIDLLIHLNTQSLVVSFAD
ncbi:hypothetical protein CMV_019596 [Castanea mollissima]|uniref:Uncharacterized protein n=1 Tax=Castanea mollissima TaxID=60419 RepID=A0A8J4QPK9_9ROSI|nr:hypothetical protein CMV_019596 [Castanea mollissima]